VEAIGGDEDEDGLEQEGSGSDWRTGGVYGHGAR
jgi:hypothetical protein